MKDLNYWLEIKESIKHYLLWAINILLEGSILILWLFTQWFVNLLISLLNVNGIESNILLIFRIIFALSLIVQVIIMSYHNMRILLIKSHDTISEEHNKDILINHLKIEKKELIKNKLTSTFQKFLPRLGAYITSILIGISILSLYVFLSKNKSYVNINALFYLILPEFLIFYSIATTKILNKSLKYLALQSVKRLFDILFSSLCLIYMLPIIGLISILIKLDSHGPIFYRSKRIGQFGVPFDCYKFRTIYINNKITWLGKFLRKTLLDELPAYYNVLVGEMSLVGPRPRSTNMLENTIDAENKILSVKPGITGLSQLSASLIFNTQVAIILDLDYINKWSLLLDAKILLKTIAGVFFVNRK